MNASDVDMLRRTPLRLQNSVLWVYLSEELCFCDSTVPSLENYVLCLYLLAESCSSHYLSASSLPLWIKAVGDSCLPSFSQVDSKVFHRTLFLGLVQGRLSWPMATALWLLTFAALKHDLSSNASCTHRALGSVALYSLVIGMLHTKITILGKKIWFWQPKSETNWFCICQLLSHFRKNQKNFIPKKNWGYWTMEGHNHSLGHPGTMLW